MNLYILLVTLIIVNAGVVPDTKCDGVIIDGHYHEKETLKTGLGNPDRLAVDYNTNIIYFSYDVNETTYISALFDLESKEFKDINDVPDGFAQAVDQNTHDVYIGGSSEIYKYDQKHHKSKLYAANDESIFNIFIKNILYFVEWPSQFVYTYIDGNIERFKDMDDTTARLFVIDGEDVMFYANDTGVYAKKTGGKDAVLYGKENSIALTTDVRGHAHMCTEDAIYKIDKMSMSLKKLMDVNICYGLAFDKDNNLIYTDDNSLVRFKKIKKTCKVLSC